MRALDTLVVHHSASRRDTTFEQVKQWHTWPRDIVDKDGVVTHVRYLGRSYPNRKALPEDVRDCKGNGWSDIGYHRVILEGGARVLGRDLDVKGAHAYPHNKRSIGILVMGDNTKPDQGWDRDQVECLEAEITALCRVFPSIVRVCGHRDLEGTETECPGLDVRALLGLDAGEVRS